MFIRKESHILLKLHDVLLFLVETYAIINKTLITK